ncbi:hypothetical protein GEV33_003533 [Tenebrio molitor]|uniref:Uncharacterized protein n=1 Tax=Tenebrio molitor TaxID=7067 RepID=A0A8J6HTC9_TENMO|nr:hypothetical protein GEV33_003533 [Tenebrio molitor]
MSDVCEIPCSPLYYTCYYTRRPSCDMDLIIRLEGPKLWLKNIATLCDLGEVGVFRKSEQNFTVTYGNRFTSRCRKREEAPTISQSQSRNPRLDISQNNFPKGQSKSSEASPCSHRSYRRILEASYSQRSVQAHPSPPKATLTGVPESSFRQRPAPQQLRSELFILSGNLPSGTDALFR